MQTSKNKLSNSTAGTSTLAEERSFDAWGRLRNPTNWTYTSVPAMSLTNRGFTGHEHLPSFGIINMNGRVYDPVLARFLSPDNFVQAPNNTQSFNRYSYVLNNPLKYTDPSGWEIFVYYVGPKYRVPLYFLLGHTGLGYKARNTDKIFYAPLSGHEEVREYSENKYNEFGFKKEVDENETMKYYLNNGETVIRAAIDLPSDVEDILSHRIANDVNYEYRGAYCTSRAWNMIYDSYIEAKYDEKTAKNEADRIINYGTPENRTEEEMRKDGFKYYEKLYLDNKGNVITKKIELKENRKEEKSNKSTNPNNYSKVRYNSIKWNFQTGKIEWNEN